MVVVVVGVEEKRQAYIQQKCHSTRQDWIPRECLARDFVFGNDAPRRGTESGQLLNMNAWGMRQEGWLDGRAGVSYFAMVRCPAGMASGDYWVKMPATGVWVRIGVEYYPSAD